MAAWAGARPTAGSCSPEMRSASGRLPGSSPRATAIWPRGEGPRERMAAAVAPKCAARSVLDAQFFRLVPTSGLDAVPAWLQSTEGRLAWRSCLTCAGPLPAPLTASSQAAWNC